MALFKIKYLSYQSTIGELFTRANSKSEALSNDMMKGFGIKKVISIKEQDDNGNYN